MIGVCNVCYVNQQNFNHNKLFYCFNLSDYYCQMWDPELSCLLYKFDCQIMRNFFATKLMSHRLLCFQFCHIINGLVDF